MPVYEYACKACGHEFEEWQKMSDKPVRTCPKCKARRVERLISATSFHLKGGGWYSDLYAGPKPGQEKDKGGDKNAGDAKASDGGEAKESKPKEGAGVEAKESKPKEAPAAAAGSASNKKKRSKAESAA